MIVPNAENRCSASEAMKDPYWTVDMDMDILTEKLMTMSSPSGSIPRVKGRDKEKEKEKESPDGFKGSGLAQVLIPFCVYNACMLEVTCPL